MVYVYDEKGRIKTLKEVAIENNVPLKLVQGRYHTGYRKIEDLIKEKHWIWKEEENEN